MSLVKVNTIKLTTNNPPRFQTRWINPDRILEVFEKDLRILANGNWIVTGLDKLYEVDIDNGENYLFIDHDSFLNLTSNNTTK